MLYNSTYSPRIWIMLLDREGSANVTLNKFPLISMYGFRLFHFFLTDRSIVMFIKHELISKHANCYWNYIFQSKYCCVKISKPILTKIIFIIWWNWYWSCLVFSWTCYAFPFCSFVIKINLYEDAVLSTLKAENLFELIQDSVSSTFTVCMCLVPVWQMCNILDRSEHLFYSYSL